MLKFTNFKLMRMGQGADVRRERIFAQINKLFKHFILRNFELECNEEELGN